MSTILEDKTLRHWFGVHPFIEANPKAVFIRRTRVPAKMDGEAKRLEGLNLAREIFLPYNRPGIPITHRIILKPNVTSVRSDDRPDEELWGTGTDPQFYEGLIQGLQELGLKSFHFIEANNPSSWNYRGFVEINRRLGIRMNKPKLHSRHFRSGRGINWTKVPDPVVFTRIPHYSPVNEPDTWLLNIAKWKAHSMCLSQSVKNEQGLVANPFVRFCFGWPMVTDVPKIMKPEIHPEAEVRITRLFDDHRRRGFARYDSVSKLSPIHQEIWAQKTCDNQSVLSTDLAMIEGIYARDGDGLGIGEDYLTNLIMFSKDKFRLDLIGLYLGGHEPGNVNICRIAKERGLTDTFNPWEIPVFEWIDGQAMPSRLSDFPRTPLKTNYLQKKGEPPYHLVNEPFDYDRHK